MGTFLDLTGKQFGRLTVMARAASGANKYGRPITRWQVLCECGHITEVTTSKLNSGHTRSCGCLQAEASSAANKTHGLRKTRSYRVWAHMKNRCYNTNYSRYHLWGGRGITICELWRDDFAAFYSYMGECPAGMSIDRIDNDGNYEPGNVRWATPIEQSNNLRTVNRYTADGSTKTLTEWADLLGVSRDTIKLRIRRGQSFEQVHAHLSARL